MTDQINQPEEENIKVFVRICPSSQTPSIIKLLNENKIEINRSEKIKETKSFHFNQVFEASTSQISVYKAVASPIVERTLRGYNGTIFAYGQSGTGKTFTMVGDITDTSLKGIIPNVFTHIFTHISINDSHTSYVLTVTFLEIYNEEVRDLLGIPQKKLEVRENPKIGVYVKDLSGYSIESLEQVSEIISKGNKNRSEGSTKLNDKSSRSHAIFTILIEGKDEAGKRIFGKLNLVDLAGSERVSKSFATGDRLREAGKINLSLSVLGSVISALIDGKTSHIPYRNSKLTRLLQDSLGGNCLTSMIATVSPRQDNYDETSYTLMYADRVKHITNSVKQNDDNKSVLKIFEDKIKELQAQLAILNQKQITTPKKKKKIKQEENPQLLSIQSEKDALLEKINNIQKKILIGGENLLQKAQLQMELLETTTHELKILDSSQQLLEEVFHFKKQETQRVERKSLSLQEEDKLLDLQIKEAERNIAKAEKELFERENEYQNQISHLLYINKYLAKDMGLVNFVVNKYVPKEYLKKIESSLVWDDDLLEWKLKFIPYCGNNMKVFGKPTGDTLPVKNNLKPLYRRYPKEGNNS